MATLTDRTVLITGSGGSLGGAAAATAAQAGAKLVLVDRHEDRLSTLREAHPAAVLRTEVVDLNDALATHEFALALRTEHPVDVVWHLVGGWRGGQSILDAPHEDWMFLHHALVETTVNVIQAFGGDLRDNPRGRFSLVSSPQAQHPTSSNAAYASAKAAAETTVRELAHEFSKAGNGATANVVVVPAIVTAAMPAEPARADEPDKPARFHVDADAIAETLVFLASPAAAKMNGQHINLYDGSRS